MNCDEATGLLLPQSVRGGGHHSQGVPSGVLDQDRHEVPGRMGCETPVFVVHYPRHHRGSEGREAGRQSLRHAIVCSPATRGSAGAARKSAAANCSKQQCVTLARSGPGARLSHGLETQEDTGVGGQPALTFSRRRGVTGRDWETELSCGGPDWVRIVRSDFLRHGGPSMRWPCSVSAVVRRHN